VVLALAAMAVESIGWLVAAGSTERLRLRSASLERYRRGVLVHCALAREAGLLKLLRAAGSLAAVCGPDPGVGSGEGRGH